MTETSPPPKYFDTKAAADYLTRNGCKRTEATLRVLRVTGGGPKFRKDGRRVIYARADLDTFIESRLSSPLGSTSEVPVQ